MRQKWEEQQKWKLSFILTIVTNIRKKMCNIKADNFLFLLHQFNIVVNVLARTFIRIWIVFFLLLFMKRSGKTTLRIRFVWTRTEAQFSVTNQIAPQTNSRELYVLPNGYINCTITRAFIYFVFKFFLYELFKF